MTTLTVSAKGQVTLRKEVLNHLGVEPGDKISLELLPGGRATLRPANSRLRSTTRSELGPSTEPALSIEEMNEIIADGWAGKR